MSDAVFRPWREPSPPAGGSVAPRTLSGALIDCDGTLVDTEPLWTLAERETIKRWGGRSSEDLERDLVGKSPYACAACIAAHVGSPPSTIETIQNNLMTAYDRVLASSPIYAMAGAEQLLQELSERGVPVVVVSNSVETHVEQALLKAGLRTLVGNLQSPGPGIRSKPAPDLYVTACDQYSIDPRWAVAIEDTQVGLDAARAADLVSVGVPSVAGGILDAHQTLGSLAEVDLNQLERLLASRQEEG
jgi:HAD superfamily hydrolase (TIGR01509 family)